MKLVKWTLAAMLAAIGTAHAAETAVKHYQLIDLKNIIQNDADCKKLFISLEDLAKKPITLNFSNKNTGEFDIKDQDNKIVNHSYKIIHQTATDNSINRIGYGSFTLNEHLLNYVLQISVDLKHNNLPYAYPIIISNEKTHCVVTGALKPDQKTLASFKKNIQQHNLDNGNDLTKE